MSSKSLSMSLLFLLAANSVPLIGVLFFGWDAVLVLALFWIENLIIGIFNVVRMVFAGALHRERQTFFLIPFFLIHYGAFCAVHGYLLMRLLGLPKVDAASQLGLQSLGLADFYLDGVAVLVWFVQNYQPQIWLGIAALFLSRLVSFIENFILQGELHRQSVRDLMGRPYAQIMIMHAGLLLGAFLLEKLGSPIWLLAVIVILKIIVDGRQLLTRHNPKRPAEIGV